jgi:hypothetical protein
MASRVFLHIGVPKSGTTYLQTTMWHNRAPLRAQGFLYPGSKRMDHYHASQDVRGQRSPATGAWEQLRTQLADWRGSGLVSHEFFSMASADQATAAVEQLAPAEVHVVLTARDYVRQFPAVWQEALKMSSTLSLDEFMAEAFAERLSGAWSWRSQDLARVLEAWSETVPPERMHVLTVPPPSAPRELLWQRWCATLGIDDSDFDMSLSVSNESLGTAQAALLHRVKPHLTGPLTRKPVQHRWVRQYFGHEVLVPQRGERFGLRPDDVTELRRRSIEAVEAIRARDCRVVGDLADLVPARDQPSRPHPDDVTEAEMLDVAGRAIDQMIRDVRRLTTERDRLRAASRDARPTTARRAIVERARRVVGRWRR